MGQSHILILSQSSISKITLNISQASKTKFAQSHTLNIYAPLNVLLLTSETMGPHTSIPGRVAQQYSISFVHGLWFQVLVNISAPISPTEVMLIYKTKAASTYVLLCSVMSQMTCQR